MLVMMFFAMVDWLKVALGLLLSPLAGDELGK